MAEVKPRFRDLVVPIRRNSMELYLYFLCIANAIVVWILPSAVKPDLATLMWSILLGIGGLVATSGWFWKDAITGLLIVRASMYPIGFGCFARALWIFSTTDPKLTWYAITVISVLGFAAIVNSVQITNLIKRRRQ